MARLKLMGKLMILLTLVFCLMGVLMGNAVTANAEEITAEEEAEAPVNPAEGSGEEADRNDLQTLIDGFLTQLKAKYGDDYETYYNAILAEWGSMQEYLLSLIDDGTVPDVAASGWSAFVNWLGTYSPIWGSILAVVGVIIVILFGKKALSKIVTWITGMNTKFKTIVSAFNTLYTTQKAQNAALIKLLGENERFTEERKALEEATGELDRDETV